MEPWNFSFKSFGRVLDRNSVTVISDFHVFSFFFFFYSVFIVRWSYHTFEIEFLSKVLFTVPVKSPILSEIVFSLYG